MQSITKAVKWRLIILKTGDEVAVLSIHHVSIVVSNTQKSVSFYSDVLGLEPCHERPELGFPGAWLTVGGQQIHLLEVENPDPVENRPEHGGRDRHLAMSVDNLDEIEQVLLNKSIAVSRSRSGRAALFFRDPDGNGVELIQKKSACK